MLKIHVVISRVARIHSIAPRALSRNSRPKRDSAAAASRVEESTRYKFIFIFHDATLRNALRKYSGRLPIHCPLSRISETIVARLQCEWTRSDEMVEIIYYIALNEIHSRSLVRRRTYSTIDVVFAGRPATVVATVLPAGPVHFKAARTPMRAGYRVFRPKCNGLKLRE